MVNILKEIHSVRSVKWGEAALRENTRHRSPETNSNLPLTALQIYRKSIVNILNIYYKYITNKSQKYIMNISQIFIFFNQYIHQPACYVYFDVLYLRCLSQLLAEQSQTVHTYFAFLETLCACKYYCVSLHVSVIVCHCM